MANLTSNVVQGLTRIMDRFRFWGSQAAASGYSWIKMLAGDIDLTRRAGRIYDNAVVAGGIFWYWRNLTYPRVRVERPLASSKTDEYERLPRHGLVRAIEHGPHYDHTVLLAGSLLSLVVAGNAYWLKIKNDAGLVIGYAWVPHTRMVPMADRGNDDGARLITYYWYTPFGGSQVPVLPEDVVHFRLGIDPENPMLGMSPLMGAMRDLVGENEASILACSLLVNGGLVGVAISPKAQAVASGSKVAPMTPAAREEAKQRFRENTRGSGAGTPNFFDFPVDVVQLGYSPEQYAMDKNRAIFVSRICAGLGLDPMILGLPSENKTYNNYSEALEAAWENTLLPILEIMGIQLSWQTLEDFPEHEEGDRVCWDVSKVRALQPDLDKLFQRLDTAFQSGWLRRSDARREAGLEVDEARDDVYITDIQAGGAEQSAKAADIAKLKASAAQRSKKARETYEAIQAEVADEPEGL